MAGSTAFPVICAMLSVTSAIVPPFLPLRPMRRYGFPNEILGSGPSFRGPPPGVLVAGHGPPVARPLGPVHHGGRPFHLMTSSSPPPPSGWPRPQIQQIQRAQEARHFEYEVIPPPTNIPKPPTLLRPVQRFPGRPPMSLAMPPHNPSYPPEIFEIIGQDGVPLQRTDRPPVIVTGVPQRANPPFATPSDADFQEGFRILNDIFNENAAHDIRSNLIGGSEVSFNGGFLPRSTTSSPTKRNVTLPPQTELVQIVAAQEKPILIAAGTPNGTGVKPTPPAPVYVKPTDKPSAAQQMQGSESSYGPPQFMGRGPPPHVSFMFTDPNEGKGPSGGAYNLYEDSPPPPFNLGGNSIIPPPTPSPPQGNPEVRTPSLNQLPPQAQSAPAFNNNGPPPPPRGNVVRNEIPPFPPLPPNNGQRPFVMVPVGHAPPKTDDNAPAPSADEVQNALGILARYASKQAQGMGMNITPQMILQQEGGPPNMRYGPPPPHPSFRYGPPSSSPPPPPPPPPQSSPAPTFPPSTSTTTTTVESVSYGAPILVSAPYSTTEANAITVSQPEESSPYPHYGPPRQQETAASGGWSSGGGGGAADLIGAKVQALKTIQSALTGGLKSVTGLKAGIFNAGLSAIGNLNRAKGDLANSLKIPIVSKSKKPIYGSHSEPAPVYGPPQNMQQTSASNGWGQPEAPGPISTLVNAVGDIVGGVTATIGQTGRAAVGIGLSKNELIKNHFVIKGQAFTDLVSKKVTNKNQYFQNVMKHIQSIFEAAGQRGGGGGWSSSPPQGWN